jgi:hypothetical protein
MGIKDKLGMPYDSESKIGRDGNGYTIYKYPPKEKQWSGLTIISYCLLGVCNFCNYLK